MAQAQAGASRRRSRTQKKTSARSRGSSNSSSNRTTKKAKQSRSKASKPSPVTAVENTAKEAGRTAKDAGKTVGRAASKAKVPLLAGGAALAGAAGGIAIGAHQARHRHRAIGKVVKRDDLTTAAKRVGTFGAQMGHLASELQHAREDSNGRHRSPVEVVLEGLTARRSRS